MPASLSNRWVAVGDCFTTNCGCNDGDSEQTVTLTEAYEEFDTVLEMLASDTTLWRMAKCQNWNLGDGIISTWLKSDDIGLLPNGTDVLQADDGAILLRTYVRENPDGTTLPSPTGSAYTVSVPVAYPTLTDFRDSTVDAAFVILNADINGDAGIFSKGGSGSDDGKTTIINAAGITYTRLTLV